MTGPHDDDLATMLRTRADRMPAAAAHEILGAVRAEIRTPSRGAGFAVLPVANGRGVTGPVGWAAIGLVAVVVLAVMGGRLSTGPGRPSSAGSASGGPGATSAAAPSTAPPTPVVASSATPTVTLDQLRAGLADGTLEGRTVLVTGRLDLLPLPCPSPMPEDCYGLQLHGLGGVDVTHAGVMTAAEAFARIPGETADRLMAFRTARDRLAFLGWVMQGAEEPLTVHEVLALPPATGPAELALVGGWLLGGYASTTSCPSPQASPCLDSRPVLADASPRPDGLATTGDATEVTVDDSLGLSQAPATIAGPFLVVRAAHSGGDLPSWRVVAGVGPATAPPAAPASPRP